MNCEFLEREGLSNLVEAATALATFSLCSRVPAISPDQTKQTYVGPSIASFDPQSTPLQGHQVFEETRVSDIKSNTLAEANKETFPQRLLAILNDDDVSSDVISWLPNGRSFIIARPDIFMESILPKYIAQDTNRTAQVSSTAVSTKYPSFTRKLNRWYVQFDDNAISSFLHCTGIIVLTHSSIMIFLVIRGFRQVTRGPETGAFHHELFRRDQPELCLQMFCQRSRNSMNVKKTPKENKAIKSTTASQSPIKKRRVSLLTKESLEEMNQEQTNITGVVTNIQSVATIQTHKPNTVSEDSQSMRSSVSGGKSPSIVETSSSSSTSPKSNASSLLLNSGIINNPVLVRRAITKRNEEERMRLAKVMLYNSFLQAMNGDDSI